MAVQEQLDSVLAAVGQGVLVLDGDRRLVHVNEAGRALLDLPPPLAEPGTPARALVSFWAERGDYGRGDPAELTAEFLALFSLPEPHGFEHRRPDGRVLAMRSRPLPGGGVVLAFHDETDYRAAVDDLHAANLTLEHSVAEHAQTIARLTAAAEAAAARAEDVLRDKARTLALVNHALRVPVGAMMEPVRALLGAPLGPDERAQVSHLLRAVDALRLILDDLGDLARLEADEVRLDEAPFAVETVVGSVLAGMGEAAGERGVSLAAGIDPSVPAIVVGDAAWLRHVLIELVGRSVRDTDAGAVAVRVVPAVLPDGRDGLRFAVGDAGPDAADELEAWLGMGMPPLDGGLRRQGLRGLGLHIGRRIVGLMGGEIGVERSPDGTCTLWFTAALGSAAEDRPAEDKPSLAILVVEDNPVNQRVNTWLLQKDGHRVTVVGDGREAVRLIAESGDGDADGHAGRFDAVLMDLDIPGLDGIAATRAIRALPGPNAAVPVIAITNSALPGDIERCRAAGMDDHLPKPVNPAALTRVLVRLTGRAAAPGDAASPEAKDGFDSGVLGALERVIGRGNVQDLVGDFLAHARDLNGQLATARADGDLPALAAAAAELKTMAGTVGLTGLYETAVVLERVARDGHAGEAADLAALIARQLATGADRLRGQWQV